jgi:hypothetical protein
MRREPDESQKDAVARALAVSPWVNKPLRQRRWLSAVVIAVGWVTVAIVCLALAAADPTSRVAVIVIGLAFAAMWAAFFIGLAVAPEIVTRRIVISSTPREEDLTKWFPGDLPPVHPHGSLADREGDLPRRSAKLQEDNIRLREELDRLRQHERP